MGRIKDTEWTLEKLIKEFSDRKYLLDMGKGKLSNIYNVEPEVIKAAKRAVRNNIKNDNFPKILIFDIESAPMNAWIWGKWKQNIYDEMIINDWFILTWSAKWLFSNDIMYDSLKKKEIEKQDDKRIVRSLRDLLDKADIVIAHNGDRFDIARINARMIYNNLNPPSSYQSIDTLKIAKKHFGFSSNKLDALAEMFGLKGKIDVSFDLWARCLASDMKAMEEMVKYNKRDVTVLEEVYLKLRPWIKSHPNIGLFIKDEKVCPNCGSNLIEKNGKYYYTMMGRFETYVCKSCGAISRERKSSVTKNEKDKLLASVAR
jgi:DNA polymerase elongation subunit (family B)